MPFWKYFKRLDRKFSWSFLGFLIAIISLGFIFFDKVIADKNPKLFLDVLTSASVLDVKEDLPKLEILFDGIDIRQQKLSLRILSIKIANDSSINITKELYDLEDPIGLLISPGKIIKTDLIDASNEYLRKNYSLRAVSENSILFKDVIIEAHQYFVVKLLVLHPADTIPSIKSQGHIAGVREIRVREIFRDQTKSPLWSKIFVGGFGIQVLRFLIYLAILGIFGLIVAMLVALPVELLNSIKRKRRVKAFKRDAGRLLEAKDEPLFTQYIKYGDEFLESTYELMKDQESLRINCDIYEKVRTKYPELARRELYPRGDKMDTIRILLASGLLKINDNLPTVDAHVKKTLMHFVGFLRNHYLLQTEKDDVEPSNPKDMGSSK